MYRYAITFDEDIAIMGLEAPHALILESWRKQNLVVNDYRMRRGGDRMKEKQLDTYLASDPDLGLSVVFKVRELRHRRNEIAHESVGTVEPEEAIAYARDAWYLVRDLALPGWRWEPVRNLFPAQRL